MIMKKEKKKDNKPVQKKWVKPIVKELTIKQTMGGYGTGTEVLSEPSS